MKTAGRSSLIPFLFYPKFVYGAPGGSRSWAWRTTGGAGRATPQNIKRYVEGYNKHLEPGGVNEHLGRREAIYGGSVVNQRTGETVAEWEDKGIIQFYKNKPMFEVVGRELLKVAKVLMAERDFPPEWDKAYGIGEQLAGQFEWSIDDAILAAMTIAEGRESALREKFRASLGDNLEKGVDFIVTEARRAAKRVSSLVKSRDQARLAILGLLAGLLETPNLHDLAALVYAEAEKEQEKAPARDLVDENTPELKAWIGMLQKITDDYHQKNFEHVKPPKFELSVGSRYIRVVSNDGVQRSAHSFIRRDNGDILKAAGWAAPAKHARGNIFAPDGGKSALTGHGSVRYLASQMVARELTAADDFSAHFYDSSWRSAVSNRQDWLEKNANDKQKLALVKIVIPGLLKTRHAVSSGRMNGKDMLLDLSVRDESIKIAEDGQVFLYGERVSNPTQFAKQHEKGL